MLGMDSTCLSFELFAICMKVYQLLLEASDLSKDNHYLQIRLRIERDKLLAWAVVANLSEDERTLSPSLRLHKQKLHGALQELRTVLVDVAAKLTRPCEEEKEDLPPPTTTVLTPLRGWFDSAPSLFLMQTDNQRNGDASGPGPGPADEDIVAPRACAALRNKALAAISKARNFPCRLRWAEGTSNCEQDDTAFATLQLARIHGLNDGIIQQFFEQAQQDAHSQLQHDCFAGLLQAHRSVDDLLALMAALTATRAYCDYTSEDERRLRLVRFKAFHVALDETGGRRVDEDEENAVRCRLGDSTALRARRICLDRRRLLVRKDADTGGARPARTCGTYEAASVWVEWKYYDHPDEQENMQVQLSKLAVLLRDKQKPDAIRAARCVGYLHDDNNSSSSNGAAPSRFGLVYRSLNLSSPSSDPTLLLPLTLFDMLTDAAPKPSLSTRVHLARAVATAVWHLHAAHIVHRGLRSDNVLFPLDGGGHVVDMTAPLLAGFEIAAAAAATMRRHRYDDGNLYRHPETQRAPEFTKLHDIYSLGVVLYEIALWKPIHAVIIGLEEREGEQQEEAEVQTKLLGQESLMGLAGEVGDVYMAAVASCLSGDFGFDGFYGAEMEQERSRGKKYEARLLLEFGERVIRKLEGIVI